MFDNRSSLSGQIENYVTDYISEYYKENFYDICIKDAPLAPSSYVFGFSAKISVNRNDKDNRESVKKSDKYLNKLDTPEGAIRLAKLTSANVFGMCPIYLSVSVSFSKYADDKQNFEEKEMRQVEDMIGKVYAIRNPQ